MLCKIFFVALIVVLFLLVFIIKSQYYKIELISSIVSDLSSSLDIDKILPKIADKISLLLNPSRISIMLLDENNYLRIRYGKNISSYALRKLKLKPMQGIAGQVLETGLPAVVKDISKSQYYYKLFDTDYKLLKKELLVSIPIKFKDIKYGVLNLHFPIRKKNFPKTKFEKIILQLIMQQVSNVIHNCFVYQSAVSDNMTKLYNHQYIISRLQEEIYSTRKFSTKLSLILFDIDHFKKINDEYGHQAGDTVITEIAKLLKEEVRFHDICGRYGGEEFCIILPNTSVSEATNVAERLRKEIETKKFFVNNKTISVTCSFGVAELTPEDTLETFIARTDKMLYNAKNSGRNKVFS